MTTIVTRAGKGSSLSWSEGDANFTNLNNDKLEISTAATTYITKVDPATSGTLTHSGDIVLSGTGKRITGDFSNATVANRVMFQTSTPDQTTSLSIIPNGVSTAASLLLENSSAPANNSFAQLTLDNATVSFRSGIRGSGSYLPMTFHTNGLERMRIDTAGNVGVGGNSAGEKLLLAGDIDNSGSALNTLDNATQRICQNSFPALGTKAKIIFDIGGIGRSVIAGYYAQFNGLNDIGTGLIFGTQLNAAGGTVERMRIDTAGNVLVTSPAGLGYGASAGGTVTQATSKSTAVTLNKPCGQITTHNAALANGTAVSFTVNNNLVGPNDTVIATAGAAFAHYLVTVKTGNTGSFEIVLRNLTGSSLAEAVVINFAIIKGATS